MSPGPTDVGASWGRSSWSFSPTSRQALAAISRDVVSSSDELGWTSVLVDHHVVRPEGQDFVLPGTPDYSLVVVLGGGQDLGVWSGGGWRWTTFTAGTIELTGNAQDQRLQRRARSGSHVVEKVNIYLPEQAVVETTEHYRRAGHRPHPPVHRREAHRDPVVVELARGLSHAVARGTPEIYGEVAMTCLVTHLLSSPFDGPEELQAGRRPGALAHHRVAAVVDLIRSHYAEPLTLDRLAAEAHISKFHFTRQFRDVTGTTPHAYLLAVRLDAARRMLAIGDLTVGQIASRCGFTRPSHFTAAYVTRFGVPPTRDRPNAVRRLPDVFGDD